MPYRYRALALGALALATACSGTAPNGRGVPCPALALAGPQLLYPIPGATGVPTAAASLLLGGTLPTSVVVDLVPATGASLTLGPLGPPPSPLPSPAATPAFPGETLQGVHYPMLAGATTYTVHYRDTETPCPIPVGDADSTFTTQ